jgi:hypothetical protein
LLLLLLLVSIEGMDWVALGWAAVGVLDVFRAGSGDIMR